MGDNQNEYNNTERYSRIKEIGGGAFGVGKSSISL